MSNPPQSPRPGGRCRLRWIAAGLLVVVVFVVAAGVAGLPWLIGVPAVRRAVVSQVNRMYAPTVIELDGASASWTGPVRLSGVVLRDGNGKAVVSSPTATLDRSLWQLLTIRPDYGTLTLHGATVDIERRADGSIDLAEALAPILEGDEDEEPDDGGPETQFTLAIDGGTLLLTSPELASPITAERLDMTLHCTPSPLSWEIALANPDAQTLGISGRYGSEEDPESSEIVVDIAGEGWPLSVAQAGVEADLVFGGAVALRIDGDAIGSAGDAVLTAVEVGGPALKGDRPRFDRIEAGWDVELAGSGVAARRLDLDSPVATVGLAPDAPEGASRWVGRVDLAALAGQLPNTIALRDGMSLERGSAEFEATVGPESGSGTPILASARLADLAARNGDQLVTMDAPVTLSAELARGEGSAVSVSKAAIESAFLRAEGQGDLDRGVTLSGAVDLAALDAQLRKWVDLGEVALSGSGRFGGDYRREEGGAAFTARLAIEGSGLRVLGITEGPIARESARLDLIVQGPAAPPGVPSGWTRVHASAKSEGAEAVVEASPVADALALKGRVSLPPAAPVEGEPAPGPMSLAFDAAYRSAEDRLDLASVEASHDLGRVRASGRIEGVSGPRVADLTGSAEPNWEAISAIVAESTEPQARLSGTPRVFRLSGPLSGGSTSEILAGIDAELGVDLVGAVVFGMDLGPTPVLVRLARGDVQINPIDTSLNGGRVVLTPDVLLLEDGSMVLTLGDGSGVDGVEITDDVSKRVLAYIAPVLREATEVNGRVSARINRLSVPLAGPAAGPGGMPIDLASRVAFQGVTYGPGPMMRNILGMSGLAPDRVPNLTIDQVVDVAIAEGRVHQTGLEITAAEGVAMQLEGSVGLDQTLALRVGVPLSDRLLGGQEVLSDVLGGTRVGVPIGGTLSQPQLDREAFRVGLRQQGGRLLGRGAAVGAGQLLRMLEDDPQAGESGGTDGPAPVAPPAEELLKGLGRGLLRDAIGGGQPGQGGNP
ncbi:hypothetical protein [Tautonia plasticadhaerens]|uniref:Uncharacterized protein n=1 Tax=Tautonia plasticadhaerens TaxID=2527974 RepID=A0A518GWH0_9BACT|nr:hypothetical protein [Tautonia plasticadhaerens]QDV32929.1 hypothetical protein ElP_07710 [Tautonia plasticadhaerens]